MGEQHGAVIKDSAVPILIDLVERGDGADQYATLKALRGFGPYATEAIQCYRKMLQSPDVQNTWIAAETLGRMKAAAVGAAPNLVNIVKKRKDECRDHETRSLRVGREGHQCVSAR